MINKYFLTQIKIHNHLRRKNERIKIACKDNASIKNTKDDLLNITCWNMHRLKGDMAEMIKNRDPYSDFGKFFLQNSIIFMSETWRDKFDQEILNWDDDFQEFPKIAAKDYRKGRSSRGNILFIRKSLLPYCEIIVHDAYHIWCKLSNSIINNADTDFFLCCVYIPRKDSRLIKSGKAFNFDILMEEVTRFDNLGKILIMGDMNSRVGTEDDFIRDDEIDENLFLPEDYLSDQIIKDRTSLDKLSGVQGHGKNLLNFCKSTSFRIMNGRWEEGEEIGKFTCFKPTGNSLVDYCLIREKDRCIIKSFRTGDISIHSDHAFLFVSLDRKSHSTFSEPNILSKVNCIPEKGTLGNRITEELRENFNCRFIPTTDSSTKIEICLRSDELESKLQCLKHRLIKDNISVDEAVEELRNICTTISQQSFKKVNFSRTNRGKNTKNTTSGLMTIVKALKSN